MWCASEASAAVTFIPILDPGVNVVLRVALFNAGGGGHVGGDGGDDAGDDARGDIDRACVLGRPVERDGPGVVGDSYRDVNGG